MKKFLMIGVAALCLVGVIGNMIGNKNFQKSYGISATLALLEKEGNIRTINFETGSVQRYTLDEYSAGLTSPLIVAIKNQEKTDIILYEKGNPNIIFSTEQYIWGHPVMVDGKVYFVASETNEERNNNLVAPDAYLWVYENGEIQKYHDIPVHNFSGIMKSGKYLLFVEWTRDDTTSPRTDDFRIMLGDTATKETNFICTGLYPCWREFDNTFFFSMPDKGLASYNLLTNSAELIDEHLVLRSSPIYETANEALLFNYPDPDNQKSIDLVTTGILYLKDKKILKYSEYFKRMSFGWKEEYYYKSDYSFWEA